ncbi:MAG: hypothetical protein AABX45_02290 [Nanoarchaeota archaeon]
MCSGNIERSVVAERCINQALKVRGLDKDFVAVSRGLQKASPPVGKNLKDYENEWSASSPVLQEIGIDISDVKSTPVDLSIVEKALLILAMDRGVLIGKPNSLAKQFPEHGYKMRLFTELAGNIEDVEDPYGHKDQETHRRVIELIHSVSTERLDALLNYVKLFQKGGR